MRSRRLMQQFAVDSWAKIKGSRINWAKQHQTSIRAEKFQGLIDTIEAADGKMFFAKLCCHRQFMAHLAFIMNSLKTAGAL